VISPQFLRFALVGAAGFVVDAATLYAAMHWAGLDRLVARVPSFLAAATFTWALNRRYTFRVDTKTGLLREWFRFLSVNSIGSLINLGAYTLVQLMGPPSPWLPLIGVAVGSVAGLLFNYLGSSRLVFNRK
jgi:putative flippase GtrA